MIVAYKSDVGKVRAINEDRFAVKTDLDELVLAIVADGMGGHQAGDVASQTAIEVIQEQLQALRVDLSLEDCESHIRAAIREANKQIFARAQSELKYQGMGTTVVVAAAVKDKIVLSHIGDSRAYLLSGNELSQLTEDHSLVNELVKTGQITVEEAHVHPRRNVLTQALGTEMDIEVESRVVSWTAGDQLLLCSDGLTNMVSLEQIQTILQSENTPEWKVERLVNDALASGGDDNITVVLLTNVQVEQEVN